MIDCLTDEGSEWRELVKGRKENKKIILKKRPAVLSAFFRCHS